MSNSGLLFDTPGLAISSLPLTAPTETNYSKRRKAQLAASSSKSKKEGEGDVSVNLEKLMKRMQKDDGWGKTLGAGGKSGIEAAEKDEAARVRKEGKRKAKSEKRGLEEGGSGGGKVLSEKKGKAGRFDPAVNSKKHKLEKKASKASKADAAAAAATGFSPASSSNFIAVNSSFAAEAEEVHVQKRAVGAPNHEGVQETSRGTPQTAMQIALRAKLAGGRFRMLNETLYTSTGVEAGETMREEGAFDDVRFPCSLTRADEIAQYHAGFRSQSAHWPVHPLSILTTYLAKLPANSLIADFGCGDATLARELVPQGLKVLSYDLVSKDAWVVECGCASVPLPGGGGQECEIVDAVVCCLSLMGTDWVDIVREARRVLKDG